MALEQFDSIVIGGGISGLAMAHYCNEGGQKTLLLERNGRLGGCIQTHPFGSCEGFWTELGAHTCYNSYGSLLQIMETCGLLDRIEAKAKVSFRMLTDKGIRSIPSQLGFGELLRSFPRIFRLQKNRMTVGEYYSQIVGAKNFARVLGPALDAVICQSAGDFPADALFRKRERRKEVIRNFTLPGGIQDIVQGITHRLGTVISAGHAIETVASENDGYLIRSSQGDEWRGRHLILATPAPVAAQLLAGSDSELAALLSRIGEARIETLAVVVRATDLALGPLAGIIAANDVFYSAVSRDIRPDPRYRGFSFHFRPDRLDETQKLDRICEVLGIQREQIVDHASTENRLPALTRDHGQLTERIDRHLAGKRLGLIGNYFAGVSIEDCLLRTRAEFQRLFV